VQVGEQIAGAKWAVKRAIQDADQHDRSEQYAQQQTPDQRRHVNEAAADDDMPTCGAGTVRSSDSDFIYLGGRVVLRDRLGSDGMPPRAAAVRPLLALCMPAGTGWTTFNPQPFRLLRQRRAQCGRRCSMTASLLSVSIARTAIRHPLIVGQVTELLKSAPWAPRKEQIVAAGYEAKGSRRN